MYLCVCLIIPQDTGTSLTHCKDYRNIHIKDSLCKCHMYFSEYFNNNFLAYVLYLVCTDFNHILSRFVYSYMNINDNYVQIQFNLKYININYLNVICVLKYFNNIYFQGYVPFWHTVLIVK